MSATHSAQCIHTYPCLSMHCSARSSSQSFQRPKNNRVTVFCSSFARQQARIFACRNSTTVMNGMYRDTYGTQACIVIPVRRSTVNSVWRGVAITLPILWGQCARNSMKFGRITITLPVLRWKCVRVMVSYLYERLLVWVLDNH